jgi:hypothetical protein
MPAVAKREGAHVVAQLPALTNPFEFYFDVRRLKLALGPLVRVGDALGMTGRGVGSFQAVWAGLAARAELLADLPEALRQKAGMVRRHLDTSVKIFDQAKSAWKLMLATPFASAARPEAFLDPQSDLAKAIGKLDKDLAKLLVAMEDAEDGMDAAGLLGVAYLPAHGGLMQPVMPPGTPTGGSVVSLGSASAQSLGSLDSGISSAQAMMIKGPGIMLPGATSGLVPKGRAEAKEAEEQAFRERTAKAHPHVFRHWGSAALDHGVWAVPGGVLFGKYMVTLKKQCDLTGICLAALGSGKTTSMRSKWCCNPGVCQDVSAHERPAGITDDDLEVSSPDDDGFVAPAQKDMTVVVAPLKVHMKSGAQAWMWWKEAPEGYKGMEDLKRKSPSKPAGKGGGKGGGKGKGKGDRKRPFGRLGQ